MRSLRPALTALIGASLTLGGVPAHANAPLKPLAVKVGQARDLTHIEFPGADPAVSRQDGKDLILRFARGPSPEASELKITPPHFLKAATITPFPGGLELRLTPADGAQVKLGKADGVSYVNLSAAAGAAPPSPAGPAQKDQTPQRRADPVPQGGVVRLQPELQGKAIQLHFPWRAPLGAALFRRGDALWMVFDAHAHVDVSAAPKGAAQFRRIEAVDGKDYSAVRIVLPPATLATATAQGSTWTLTLGATAVPPQGVVLGRDDQAGPVTLTAQVAGSTGVFWVDDPAVGDRVAVVTALGPAKGLDQRRVMVDATLMPSLQGLAIQPATDDLAVTTDGDVVRIGRPRGLALSSATAQLRRVASAGPVNLPVAAALPALVDFAAWSKTGEGGFIRRYNELQDAASAEAAKGKAGGVQARLGLARFLVGSELSYEAIGVLNLLAKTNPHMLGDSEFRGLRGAARAMAGRYRDAQADFSSPVLTEDPASALWRGYAAAKLGDFAGAREQFIHGRSALYQFATEWKARFARLDAEAAMMVGDIPTARNQLAVAAAEHVSPSETDAIHLAQARLDEAQNQPDQALALYDQASKSNYGAIAAPAVLHATQLKLARGKMSPADAVAALGSLRFRWRGDATELDVVRALGHIYLSQGRYREALEALRSAGQRSPDQPASLGVSNDLATAFRALFLDGQADGMQPIQAVALFKDFKELTPIGADGDLMVRKLVHRLVDVDLLDEAADTLKYQVDNRLDGVAKAQVSNDLATIFLMDKKPEQALEALNASRTTLLPTALNAQRRVVEARALLALGRGDHALELLAGDKTPEAADVRAEAAWKQRAWGQAGGLLEGQLGDRWKNPQPLSGEEQGRLMRAGVAYSLASDDAGLTRLRTRYGKLSEAASAPDALRVALAGVQDGALTTQDFARASSDAAAFSGWVSTMKKRFTDKLAWPLQGPAAPPTIKQAATTAAPAKPATKPAVRKG